MQTRYTRFKRILAAVLALVMVLGLTSGIAPAVTAIGNAASRGVVDNSKKSDPSTMQNWEALFGTGKMDTEYAGGIWTDKSVFTDATPALPGITLSDSDNFLIALSAIAGNSVITGQTTSPTDTMLVLDLSGSMVDDTYEVGTVRRGNNNYDTVDGIDTAIIEALVDSTNDVIGALMQQNPNNRVGVVLYSGNTSQYEAATAATATLVLPLDRYTGVNGEYLSLNAPTTTSTLYRWVQSGWYGGSWQENGTATYVPEGTDITVSVKSGLKTETGGNVSNASKQVVGGTYIQNGLYKAMNEFLDVQDTIVPDGKPQAGADRTPVLVLMSDGAPTIATTSYMGIGNSNTGDGTSENNSITFLTQLTAAYAKAQITDHYDKDAVFLTLGLGTSNSTAATDTLYPAGTNETVRGYWTRYLAANNGATVDVINGQGTLDVTRSSLVTAMNYVDKYYYASDAGDLIDSFSQILTEIQLRAETYTTLVTEIGADLSGYVSFEDELGEMMEVADMKGILIGNTRYTGREIAYAMNDGTLGTVNGPTELGDELVRTVKERIGNTVKLTTTQAQQLVDHAYNADQLRYYSDTNWSNYIGWYADADGNYVGFWDANEYGYENAPADAVYANKSYGYLGDHQDSNMMHVVVMVRTRLSDGHQTVNFHIPASLIPTVTYRVTLNAEDQTKVDSFVREDAKPMHLVFEVGLRSDINAVNLAQKAAEHEAAGGHIHEENGVYSFYTNAWGSDNDKDQDGHPDYDEALIAKVATAHYNPARDNSRYYFTEDHLVLDGAGNPVTGSKPTGTGYQHKRAIYNQTTRTDIVMPLSAATLEKAQQNGQGQWYIPAGEIYQELTRFRQDKTNNNQDTHTLEYSGYPAVYTHGAVQEVYNFLGNNGIIKLTPATGFTLKKLVDGQIPNVSAYTFNIALSGIPAGQTADPVVTDANGDALANVTSTAYENGAFQVTLPADVTAYITGIPVGTQVSVTEVIDAAGDYKISSIKVNGADQALTAPATFTVPAAADPVRMIPVVFTNTSNKYGDLTIVKDVHHELAQIPAELAGKIFTFSVDVGTELKGNTYVTDNVRQPNVTVAPDGTITVTLHDNEEITIQDLPEGTQYTVTEVSTPAGFTNTSGQYSGTIDADGTDEAHFINEYSHGDIQIDFGVSGNKILNGTSFGAEDFTFRILKLDPADDTFKPITGAEAVVSFPQWAQGDAATATKGYQINLSDTLEEIGTYYYRVVEVQGSTPGMTYDSTIGRFRVTVRDEGMNGQLSAVVEQWNGSGWQAVTENAGSYAVTQNFTNTYQVNSTYADIVAHKNLANETGVSIPLETFSFRLQSADSNTAVDETKFATANGYATFRVVFDHAGTYTFKLTETDGGKARMSYDLTPRDVTVVVENNNGALEVTSVDITGGTAGEFYNTYDLGNTAVTLSGTKVLKGMNAGTFRFALYETGSDFQITGAAKQIRPVSVTDGEEDFSFSPITYTRVGTYYYSIKEIAETTPGVVYDHTHYHVTVTVTADETAGKLIAGTPVITKIGVNDDQTGNVVFVNRYTVSGQQAVTVGGSKELTGREMIAGEFKFGLYDATGKHLTTAQNLPNGTFVFETDELTYTPADLGENNAPKTYTYTVKEILPDGAVMDSVTGRYVYNGVYYDPVVYTVTVEVSHSAGQLVVTPSSNATALAFENWYKADDAQVQIHGKKNWEGDWNAVTNKTFSFLLYEADAAWNVTNSTPQIVTNDANGEFSFSKTYRDGQENTYYYILREDTSAAAGGVGYDAGIYRITVNVTDPGMGKLEASVSMYRPGVGNIPVDQTKGGPVAQFSNRYSVAQTQLTPVGTKTLTGRDMEAGEFNFLILDENGNVASHGTNAAAEDGVAAAIIFENIIFTQKGQYTFTIVEVAGDKGGVSYTDKAFRLDVSVVDNGDGTLTATPSYTEAVAFENTYTTTYVDLEPEGAKTLIGRDMEAGEFEFHILDAAGKVVSKGFNAAAENGKAAKITFETIRYLSAGEYTYTVVEVKGNKSGVSYTDTTYTLTVTVTDNLDGTLSAAYRANGQIAFTNTYTISGEDSLTFGGNKTLTGDRTAVKAEEFAFGLYDAEGKLVEKVTNGADGKFTFASLTFGKDDIGTATYVVKEIAGEAKGITYDTTVYTVVVTVADNGAGGVEATYTVNGKAAEAYSFDFVNTYKITDSADLELTGVKSLTGRPIRDGEFSFGLYDAEGKLVDQAENVGGKFALLVSGLNKAHIGRELTYTVKEIPGSVPGVTYDNTVYTVRVTVADNGAGGVKVSYAVDGGKEIAFANTYQAEATTVTVGVEKTVKSESGQPIGPDGFSFQLKDATGKLLETVQSGKDGKAIFKALEYKTEGSHTYTVSEVKGNADGVIYDQTVHTITVDVKDNGVGKLEAEIRVDGVKTTAAVAEFVNIYEEAETPDTGDGFNMVLCWAVLSLSGMALVAIIAGKKYLVK